LETEPLTSVANLERLLEVLVALYAVALGLPDVDCGRKTDSLRRYEDSERTEFRRQLCDRLGSEHRYRLFFNPFEEDAEAVSISLLEDLCDIYFDVKPGLFAIGHGSNLPRRVIWDWRFGFRSHWWWHATGAMRALNALVVRGDRE